MTTRKEMKKGARHVVRKHYGILLIVCLLGTFLGAEFSGTLDFVTQYNTEKNMEMTGEQEEYELSTGATTGSNQAGFLDVLATALSGDVEQAKEMAEKIVGEAVTSTKDGEGSKSLGRSRGVLAGLVNGLDSGTILVSAISAAQNIGASTNAILILFIALALAIAFLIWFFLTNMYKAVSRRIFLESRTYEHVPFQRFLTFLRVKRWGKVSVSMFMTSLLSLLWTLTIVGGVIKRYSYYMVPYILAENPDINWREAITLSRKMMDGHKWECFIFELSFILWDILGWLSFGIVSLFYVNPYKIASFSEYYASLRKLAKENKIDGSCLMNDTYLFEKAEGGILQEAYADMETLEKMPEEAIVLTGFSGFLANVFGITISNREDEKKYEKNEERKIKVRSYQAVEDGLIYPERLFPIPEQEKNSRLEHIHYLRHYSIPSLILLFFIFAFIGWTWEVTLHLITDGKFVNRGVMHGPWLPIYGTGGVLILIALNKLRKNPVIEFFGAIVLCGCVEYFTSYFLELTHNGQKWWDYSGYFLNLNGRICAEGLLIFGLGGMAIVYVAAPLLDNHLRKLKYRIAIPLCGILLAVFIGDKIYSSKYPNAGEGITDYKGACAVQQEDWRLTGEKRA